MLTRRSKQLHMRRLIQQVFLVAALVSLVLVSLDAALVDFDINSGLLEPLIGLVALGYLATYRMGRELEARLRQLELDRNANPSAPPHRRADDPTTTVGRKNGDG